MAGYDHIDVSDLEPAGPGGAVRFVRRELGALAFGFNHFTLAPGVEGREHDERGSGQEEVMLVLEGGGTLRVDGEEIELRRGRFVRLDPEVRRQPVAGPDGLVFVMFGAPRDRPYEPRAPF